MGQVSSISRRWIVVLWVFFIIAPAVAYAQMAPSIAPIGDPLPEINIPSTSNDPVAPPAAMDLDIKTDTRNGAFSDKPPSGEDEASAALVFAAAGGGPQEVKKALEEGAKPDSATNSAGASALSQAAMRKDEMAKKVIDILLEAGADINIKDSNGQTPLFYAARAGSSTTAIYLIQKGADYYAKDKDDATARVVAYNTGNKNFVSEVDGYLTSRTEEIMKQYEERNKLIQQRNEEYAQRNEELQKRYKSDQEALQKKEAVEKEDSDKKALSMRERAEKIRKVRKAAKKRIKAAQEKEELVQATPYSRKQKESAMVNIQQLSYHTCAEKYWYLTYLTRMQSELTRSELRKAIDENKQKAAIASDKLIEKYGAGPGYLIKITEPSETEIAGQLDLYPTNAHREAEGVGTVEDMKLRCSHVAALWEFDESKRSSSNQDNAKKATPAKQTTKKKRTKRRKKK